MTETLATGQGVFGERKHLIVRVEDKGGCKPFWTNLPLRSECLFA